MGDTFANVQIRSNLIRVDVLRARPQGGEFSKLVEKIEMLYMSFRTEFIVAMNLSKISKLEIFEALQWMAMFYRVMPVTKKYLRCTCVCFTPELDAHVQNFLRLYNPIKPFHTFHESGEFENHVESILPSASHSSTSLV